MRAPVLLATFTLDGELSSFHLVSFQTSLATMLGVPTEAITFTLASGSVIVSVRVVFPAAAAATDAAQQISAATNSALSDALHVDIQRVDHVAVSVATIMLSPPPPPLSPSPPALPAPSAQRSNTSANSDGSGNANDGIASIAVIVGGCVLLISLCCVLVVIVVSCSRTRQQQPLWLRLVSVKSGPGNDTEHPAAGLTMTRSTPHEPAGVITEVQMVMVQSDESSIRKTERL
jgi:hypothetical protein